MLRPTLSHEYAGGSVSLSPHSSAGSGGGHLVALPHSASALRAALASPEASAVALAVAGAYYPLPPSTPQVASSNAAAVGGGFQFPSSAPSGDHGPVLATPATPGGAAAGPGHHESVAAAKLKLFATDFAHRMDDPAVLRSRRDSAMLREGWPTSTSTSPPSPAAPSKSPTTTRAAPPGSLLTSFLRASCIMPTLYDLDPAGRAQMAALEASASASAETGDSVLARRRLAAQTLRDSPTGGGTPSPASPAKRDHRRRYAETPTGGVRGSSSSPTVPTAATRKKPPVRAASADLATRRAASGTPPASTANTPIIPPNQAQAMALPVYAPLLDPDSAPVARPVAGGGSGRSGGAPASPPHQHQQPYMIPASSTPSLPARARPGRPGSASLVLHTTTTASASAIIQHPAPTAPPAPPQRPHSSSGTASRSRVLTSVGRRLYSPSRSLVMLSDAPPLLGGSVHRLPNLRRLGSMFPTSGAGIPGVTSPTVPRSAGGLAAAAVEAAEVDLGLHGVRYAHPGAGASGSSSRGGFAAAPTGGARTKRAHATAAPVTNARKRNARAGSPSAGPPVVVVGGPAILAATSTSTTAAAAVQPAGPAQPDAAAAAAAAISAKYDRMSALPRLEFARATATKYSSVV
ncbi:hypothetical protein H9P43_009332 [Blastocladiella emersonii ATCC 22665]|nr:hypothetical protein H9P43_009332 [Blastocladiella emersonii ATCC 22665]